MLKKHMAACLVVTAFAAAPALAQTSTTSPSAPTDRPAASGTGTTSSGSPAMQPGASGSSSTMSQSSSTMSQSGGMQGQFMTKMETNQMMASDLIGTRVVGANNESIGDINDVIMDRNGQIMAAVVGVGGFLGIGEKDVAVPFNALEFMNAQQAQAMNNNASSGNSNVATTGSTTTTGNTATTGSGTAGASNTTASNTSSNQNQPERVVLRMTKDQLQAAPAFDEDGDNANRSTTGSAGQSGTSTAPKQ
ncbi:sporulation protein YlmC with PRC-barrel domain [Microvirga lupini]|uniref:Sporulation protein YlmC with PRC-barrel domain n=1 Tax=Microvirga lupini TaxID=420324 RepID=A0A7W4YWA0_9HYPH|nr:PRC-barrel domain-containing protein [Microvirga lupini]MBB3018696.1 sporulation protein YlmC with PRC-barrel domain [Microvirga lupini]